MADIVGVPGAYPLRPGGTWDSRSGTATNQRWRCSTREIALAVVGQLRLAGISSSYEPEGEGPSYIVTARMGDNNDATSKDLELQEVWDVEGSDLEKSIWAHPKTAQLMADFLSGGIPTDTYVKVKQDILGLADGSLNLNQVQWFPDATPLAKQLIRAVVLGVDSYQVSQYVVTRTRTYARGATIDPKIQENVGSIFTAASFLTNETPPTWVQALIPTSGYWKKQTPKGRDQSDGKVVVVSEWWYAESYDPYLYSNPI